MGFWSIWLQCATVIACVVVLLWIVSLALRDVSFIDVFWGAGFAVIAWTAYWLDGSRTPRGLLMLTLVSLWSVRLASHLLSRWMASKEEDARYAAMRARTRGFAVRSLVTVFGLQGAAMMVVALPVVAGIQADAPHLGLSGLLGLAFFCTGFLVEARADAELTVFRGEPENAGKVLDTGLWAWSRHPNYFGEIVIWWGFWLLALAGGTYWWTAIGPALMTWLIIRVSGADLLERHLLRSKPGYAAYVERTSKLVPLPPRRESRAEAGRDEDDA